MVLLLVVVLLEGRELHKTCLVLLMLDRAVEVARSLGGFHHQMKTSPRYKLLLLEWLLLMERLLLAMKLLLEWLLLME